MCYLKKISGIPTCVDYCFNPEDEEGESLLLFGDADGGLTIVRFSQPLNSLFNKDEVDSVQCLFWPDMEKHAEFARIQYYGNVHSDSILGLKYLSRNQTGTLSDLLVFFKKKPLLNSCFFQ